MRTAAALFGLILVGLSGWFVGGRLSQDAIGMAVGILFGILAGIPAALMVLASQRHRGDQYATRGAGQNGHYPQQSYANQPPVIVYTGQPTYSNELNQAAYNQSGYNQAAYNQPPPHYVSRGRQWQDTSFSDDGADQNVAQNEMVLEGQFRVMDEQEEQW